MPKKTADRWDGVYEQPDREGYIISWKDAQGRRKRRTVKVSRKEDARAVLAQEKHRVEEHLKFGKPLPTKDSFEEFAAEFLKHQERRISPYVTKGRLSQVEFTRQKGIVEKYLIPFFGSMRLATVRNSDVIRYVNARMGAGISDGSLIKETGTLKRLFSIAVDQDKIAASPATKLKDYLPKAPEGRNRYLKPKELGLVLRSCPEWLRPIVGLAVSLGTRRGELLAVRWEDVNMTSGKVHLRKTKNGKERDVFLNDLARQVLISMGAGKQKRGLVFPDVTPAQVTVAFIRACDAAGIEDFSFHDLRHTFASQLRMAGADLHDLKELMGHADLRMTTRYAHLSADHLESAAKRLDGVLSLVPTTDEEMTQEATEKGQKEG
jgi:integrase